MPGHMEAVGRLVRFGPYEIDLERRTARRDGQILKLTPRNFAVLELLLERPGEVVLRETFITRVWRDAEIGDGSLNQAISTLRGTFDALPAGVDLIEAHRGTGFRFAAPVEFADVVGVARSTDPSAVDVHAARVVDIDALLAPHMAFVTSRADLEALDRERIPDALATFAAVLANPASRRQHVTSAHIGMANALMLRFESTRADEAPDDNALQAAEPFARIACQRAPESADAWGALALVFHRLRQGLEALAAAHEAVSLAPHEWRHHLRLAFVAGGDQRLRAAERVLDLSPRNAPAHWLAATVFVARQAFDRAADHLERGCAAQDSQRRGDTGAGGGRVRAVGLHWLRGLVLARLGDRFGAAAAFERELSFEGSGHIYERETCAATFYAMGALARRSGDLERAAGLFTRALQRLPRHVPSAIALRALSGREGLERLEGAQGQDGREGSRRDPIGVAIAGAIGLSLNNQHPAAARLLLEALESHGANGPGAAWIVPVEPSLDVASHPQDWQPFLDRLNDLAS